MDENNKIGTATFKHLVTGEEYKMGFDYDPRTDTALSAAWNLVEKTVAFMTGWNAADIFVTEYK